jgi:hypothetical protein
VLANALNVRRLSYRRQFILHTDPGAPEGDAALVHYAEQTPTIAINA